MKWWWVVDVVVVEEEEVEHDWGLSPSPLGVYTW